MATANYNDSVFINCPFDDIYSPLLKAIVYTIYKCGFLPITALAEDNGLQNRLAKIEKCIETCKYGIHDISRTELNKNNLPRFNMPFELGVFFGAKRFGNREQKNKNALIFDSERYRYLEFISDINGVDIKAHNNDANTVIRKIRDWLVTSSKRVTIPTAQTIQQAYQKFLNNLPAIAQKLNFEADDIPFNDFCVIVEESIKNQNSL